MGVNKNFKTEKKNFDFTEREEYTRSSHTMSNRQKYIYMSDVSVRRLNARQLFSKEKLPLTTSDIPRMKKELEMNKKNHQFSA